MSGCGPRLPSSASTRDGSYRGTSRRALSTTAESDPRRPSSEWIAGLNLATRPLVSITAILVSNFVCHMTLSALVVVGQLPTRHRLRAATAPAMRAAFALSVDLSVCCENCK
jgi:hypothetical protein